MSQEPLVTNPPPLIEHNGSMAAGMPRMPDLGQNFIGGVWVAPDPGRSYEQRNPANLDDVTGSWPRSTATEARAALDAAAAAFADWSSMTVHARAGVLRVALRQMVERAPLIEAVIVAENGKTRAEARAEVAAAIREMEHQIEEGVRQAGEVIPSSQGGVVILSRRVPLGVAVLLTPWNFPFNVPARKVVPALVTGNTCVLKPSSLTPGTADEFVRCFEHAGLPPGVLNLVHGGGSEIGDVLTGDRRVAAVSFTGSTPVGLDIHARASAMLARTQMEMGGKNPLVILADADLEAAVDAAITAGYACAGQWCTATSRVIVERSIADDLVEALAARVDSIILGPGDDPAVTMGPVCGERQLQDVLSWIERGRQDGAQLVRGGHRVVADGLGRGCFVAPTVFAGVEREMAIAQEEIFGPVVSVMRADDLEHAIEIANDVRFGLASSVFTNDIERAMRFIERSDVGLTHVNMHTAYKEPQAPFGGTKLSGTGLPEAGRSGVEFFTRHRVAYLRSH